MSKLNGKNPTPPLPLNLEVSQESNLECDALPVDASDAVPVDISDALPVHGLDTHFNMHDWKWNTSSPTTSSIQDVRVRPDGCQTDASRSQAGCSSCQNLSLLPYGCHTALSKLLRVPPYTVRRNCADDEYTFPVRLSEYCRYERRLKTFQGKWPKYLAGPTPQELARSGFVYLSEGDKVKCFSCGMVLHQWKPQDCAFYEHARWSPHCHYLRLVGDITFPLHDN